MIENKDQVLIAAGDRCFNYGDGCFTTIYCYDGEAELLTFHVERLVVACQRLGINGVNEEKLRHSIESTCAKIEGSQVVKVLISRGVGGRGYQPPYQQDTQFQVYFSYDLFPNYYAKWINDGIKLMVSPIKLGINPHLAGLKHCNRLEQVLIKQHMKPSIDDVLVMDVNNHLVECSASNLFWYKNHQWYTPSLEGSGVSGVMRQRIVEVLAKQQHSVETVDVGLTLLFDAEAVMTCNAITGPVMVNQIDFGTELLRRQGQGCNLVEFTSKAALELIEDVRHGLLNRPCSE